jgi:Cu/Ag efflux protein CusF
MKRLACGVRHRARYWLLGEPDALLYPYCFGAVRFAGADGPGAASASGLRGAEALKRRIVVAAMALLLAACASTAAVKRYPMEGDVKALDAATKTATIDAGKIGDWMEAMTMEYPVKPAAEFQKLHVGDRIEATVIVGDPAYYVTEIKLAPK